jgi:hypothetical protein
MRRLLSQRIHADVGFNLRRPSHGDYVKSGRFGLVPHENTSL